MDRRAKATENRDRAKRLNDAWDVGATQVRYSDDGHWYATLARFPAARFDANGYELFATEQEYGTSAHLRIGRRVALWARALKTHPPDVAAPRAYRGNRSKERAVPQSRIGQFYSMFM